MAELLFYVLSAGAIACAAGVIASRSPLRSVLSLLGSFVCLAGIYLLAGFHFLAAAQLLVYAGAIMVLFLFVVMLLNLDRVAAEDERPGSALGARRLGVAFVASSVLVLTGLFSIGWDSASHADPALAGMQLDDLTSIAALLFSRYMLPFEAASLLLLGTMIAVVVLAKRDRGPDRAGAVERDPYTLAPRDVGENLDPGGPEVVVLEDEPEEVHIV